MESYINLQTKHDRLQSENRALRASSEAQVKRIAELEADQKDSDYCWGPKLRAAEKTNAFQAQEIARLKQELEEARDNDPGRTMRESAAQEIARLKQELEEAKDNDPGKTMRQSAADEIARLKGELAKSVHMLCVAADRTTALDERAEKAEARLRPVLECIEKKDEALKPFSDAHGIVQTGGNPGQYITLAHLRTASEALALNPLEPGECRAEHHTDVDHDHCQDPEKTN